jgi:hypothetical protein
MAIGSPSTRAFAEAGVPIQWDGPSYGGWLADGWWPGAHPRRPAPAGGREPDPSRVEALQARKQAHYATLLASGGVTLRPGVAGLLRAAEAAGLRQVIVTTSGRSGRGGAAAPAAARWGPLLRFLGVR